MKVCWKQIFGQVVLYITLLEMDSTCSWWRFFYFLYHEHSPLFLKPVNGMSNSGNGSNMEAIVAMLPLSFSVELSQDWRHLYFRPTTTLPNFKSKFGEEHQSAWKITIAGITMVMRSNCLDIISSPDFKAKFCEPSWLYYPKSIKTAKQ